jgi:hypothetical protein
VLLGKGAGGGAKTRKATLAGFTTHDISSHSAVDIIVHCTCLGEGYDNPLLSVGVMLRHNDSLPYFAQAFAGRNGRHLDISNCGLDHASGHELDPANNICHLVAPWCAGQRKYWDRFCAF